MAIESGQWWTEDQSVFSSSEIWTLLTVLGESGVDGGRILADARYPVDQLLDPGARLSLKDIARIFVIARGAGMRNIPTLIGRRLHLSTFGIPGFAVMSSPTVEQGFEMIARYAPLLNIRFPVTSRYQNRITLRYRPPSGIDRVVALQIYLTDVVKLVSFTRDMLGPTYGPVAASLGCTELQLTNCDSLLRDLLERDEDRQLAIDLELDPLVWRRPLLQAHPGSHRRSVEHCQSVLEELRASSDIKTIIAERFRNAEVATPTLSDLAHELGMSERTLRRRLSQSGTTYSQLRDEIREGLAVTLLMRPGTTTEDVAEHLGYSDAANFRHAFKRWHGEAPSRFRRRMASQAESLT